MALNQPVGHLFAEARPYAAHPGLLRLADPTSDFSFPSDHAVMAGAVAAGLLLVSRRLGLVAAAAAVLWRSPGSTSRRTTRGTSSPDSRSALPSLARLAAVAPAADRADRLAAVAAGVRAWFGEQPLGRQRDVAPVESAPPDDWWPWGLVRSAWGGRSQLALPSGAEDTHAVARGESELGVSPSTSWPLTATRSRGSSERATESAACANVAARTMRGPVP